MNGSRETEEVFGALDELRARVDALSAWAASGPELVEEAAAAVEEAPRRVEEAPAAADDAAGRVEEAADRPRTSEAKAEVPFASTASGTPSRIQLIAEGLTYLVQTGEVVHGQLHCPEGVFRVGQPGSVGEEDLEALGQLAPDGAVLEVETDQCALRAARLRDITLAAELANGKGTFLDGWLDSLRSTDGLVIDIRAE